MKFVIISNPRFQVPPEMIIPILGAFSAFVSKYTESSNIKESWSVVGPQGGGAIISVDSHEELDAIMTENPSGPFSAIDINPVFDLQESLKFSMRVAQTRMEAMSKMGAG